MTERTEYALFTREQIAEALKVYAKMHLVGTIYYGAIAEQEARWLPDGSCEVLTKHQPCTPQGSPI